MDKLPLLLIGGGHIGQARVFLPVARPLYFLASPRQPALSANCRPIIVGEKKHELALEQWQQAIAQYPGHAALANIAVGQREGSWHQLRQQIKGLPAVGFNAQDRRILLFLLQNRLDSIQAEQWELASALRQANARLMASLDHQGPTEELLTLLRDDDDERANSLRLALWGAAAGQISLPAAIWAVPRHIFAAWRQPCLAQATLPWPLEWQESLLDFLNHGLRYLQDNLDAFPGLAHELAGQWREKLQHQPLVGEIGLYCLPGAAQRALLKLEQTPDDFICLVG